MLNRIAIFDGYDVPGFAGPRKRKGKKKRGSKRRARRSGSQRAKFGKVARSCWAQLRAGKLPRKGMFGACMRKGLR